MLSATCQRGLLIVGWRHASSGSSDERDRRRKRWEEAKGPHYGGRTSSNGRIVETRIRGAAFGSQGACPARSGGRLNTEVRSSENRALAAMVRAPREV